MGIGKVVPNSIRLTQKTSELNPVGRFALGTILKTHNPVFTPANGALRFRSDADLTMAKEMFTNKGVPFEPIYADAGAVMDKIG